MNIRVKPEETCEQFLSPFIFCLGIDNSVGPKLLLTEEFVNILKSHQGKAAKLQRR